MLFSSIRQKDIPHGTRVLVRASLNVPVEDGEVAGLFRLQKTAKTIALLKRKGARVTVIGHLGRDGASLAPVHKALSTIVPLSFVPQIVGEVPYAARKNLQPGEALLLENTRIDPREEKNDGLFVEEIAAQTDLFVFDDFSAAHREHASTTGLIDSLPSCAGVLFYEEVTALLRLTDRLEKPSIAVIGGAKCDTKIPLIERLLDLYDTIFIGGALANSILKQRGFFVGASRVDSSPVPETVLHSKKIILPHDVIVTKDFSDSRMVPLSDIEPNDIIVDIGDKTLKAIHYHFESAKTILLNGPLGWCEKGFCAQSIAVSALVGAARAYSFAGGGETVALLEQHDLLDDWQFVSTGGGSLLTYLATGTLPVIEALERKIAHPTAVAPSPAAVSQP